VQKKQGVDEYRYPPKPFAIGFRPMIQSLPAGLLALGSSTWLSLPDGVDPISGRFSPFSPCPRLQRRDRHGISPCSGMLERRFLQSPGRLVNPEAIPCLETGIGDRQL